MYIVGEDAVTIHVLHRIIAFCAEIKHIETNIIAEFPVRGGQIKEAIANYNKLALVAPVILLTDLDDVLCAPTLINRLLNGVKKNKAFVINIAVDEAEAWLMADRIGFAEYFNIDINALPMSVQTRQGGRNYCTEMDFQCKSSYDFTHRILQTCTNPVLIKQLQPQKGATKGPEYNSVIIPFIQKKWDINAAKLNSNSLDRMIKRIIFLMS